LLGRVLVAAALCGEERDLNQHEDDCRRDDADDGAGLQRAESDTDLLEFAAVLVLLPLEAVVRFSMIVLSVPSLLVMIT
jgi:hypothetical protein